MRRSRLVALAVFVAVLGTSCGDDGDGEETGLRDVAASPETTSTTSTTLPDSTATTAGADERADAPEVDVLDPGAEPRQELRYRLEPGSAYQFLQELAFEQTISGTTVTYTTSTETSVTVESVDDDVATIRLVSGATTVEVPADAPPELATQLESAMAALEGAVTTLRMDARGRVLDSDIDLGDGGGLVASLADQLTSSMSQLAVPFPDEPVGPGARWRTTVDFDVSGVTTEVTNEITLTSVADGVIDASFVADIEQSGLATGSGQGSGTYRLDLTTPVPELESTVESSAQAQGAEFTQRTTQRMVRVG